MTNYHAVPHTYKNTKPRFSNSNHRIPITTKPRLVLRAREPIWVTRSPPSSHIRWYDLDTSDPNYYSSSPHSSSNSNPNISSSSEGSNPNISSDSSEDSNPNISFESSENSDPNYYSDSSKSTLKSWSSLPSQDLIYQSPQWRLPPLKIRATPNSSNESSNTTPKLLSSLSL